MSRDLRHTSTSRVPTSIRREANSHSFGDTLKQVRETHDMTQEQLAQSIQRSTSFISLLQTNRRRPSRQLIDEIAQALALSDDSDERLQLIRSAGYEPDEISDSVNRLVDAIAAQSGIGETGKLLAQKDLAAQVAGWLDYFRLRRHFDLGSIRLALTGYDQALARQHLSPALMTWLRMGLAETLVQRGDITRAEATIRDARTRAEALQRDSEWSPTLGAEVRAVQGLVALHGDNFPEARPLIEQAIGEYEKLLINKRVSQDVVYLGLGASYKRLGQAVLSQGEPGSALTLILTADAYLKQASDSPERSRWLNRTSEMLAWVYSRLKEFALANDLRKKTHERLHAEADKYGQTRNRFYQGDDFLAEINARVAEALGGKTFLLPTGAAQTPALDIHARNEAIRAVLREQPIRTLLDQAALYYRDARDDFERIGQDALLGRSLASLGAVLRYRRLRDGNQSDYTDAHDALIKALVHEGRIGQRRRLIGIYETLADLSVDEYEASHKGADLAQAYNYYRIGLMTLAAPQGATPDSAEEQQRARMLAAANSLKPLISEADVASRTDASRKAEKTPGEELWYDSCQRLIDLVVRRARDLDPKKYVAPLAYSTKDDDWVERLLIFERQAKGRIVLKNGLSDSLSDTLPAGLSPKGAPMHTERHNVFIDAVARARTDEDHIYDLCWRGQVEADLRNPSAADLVYPQVETAAALLEECPDGYTLEGAPYELPLAFAVSGSQALIEAPVSLAWRLIGEHETRLRLGGMICLAFDDAVFADELRAQFWSLYNLSCELNSARGSSTKTAQWLTTLLEATTITAEATSVIS